MKAYVLHGIGDFRYEDVALPALPDGFALVKVLAAGVCSSDIPRIYDIGTRRFPIIPGHEFCGRVTAVASQSDNGFIGQYVGVFPLIPCKQCESCRNGEYQLCENYNYLGSRCDGGFAEYAAVPTWNLISLQEGVPPEYYALLEVAAVSLHAVKRAEINAGASVCVVGSGAVGFLVAQWGRLHGVENICVLGQTEQKAVIAEAVDVAYRQSTNQTYDVVFEAVGSMNSLSTAIGLLKPRGTLILLGNPTESMIIEKNLYWKILRKELTVKGTWNSQYESNSMSEWSEAANAIAQNKLNVASLITHFATQEELVKHLNMVRLKQEMCCKVVMLFNESQ